MTGPQTPGPAVTPAVGPGPRVPVPARDDAAGAGDPAIPDLVAIRREFNAWHSTVEPGYVARLADHIPDLLDYIDRLLGVIVEDAVENRSMEPEYRSMSRRELAEALEMSSGARLRFAQERDEARASLAVALATMARVRACVERWQPAAPPALEVLAALDPPGGEA